MTVELSVSFDGRTPLPQLLEQARAAESAGAASFWIASHLFLRDPFSTAAAVLGVTTRPQVALMAVSPQAMHPVHIAMAAATLDELAPGRVVLSIGTGAPGDLTAAGIEPRRRFTTLRETIEITRALLGGERVRHRGEIFRLEGRHLEPRARPVPVVLAASGEQTLELAGAVADGILLPAGSSVEFVRWALGRVDRGAKGRRIRRTALVYAAVGEHEGGALARFRRSLAVTLRGDHHARNLELAGVILDREALSRATAAGDWTTAEDLISDDIVRRHTASGTPAAVRERLAAYRASGLDEIVLAGLSGLEQTTQMLTVAAGDARRVEGPVTEARRASVHGNARCSGTAGTARCS